LVIFYPFDEKLNPKHSAHPVVKSRFFECTRTVLRFFRYNQEEENPTFNGRRLLLKGD